MPRGPPQEKKPEEKAIKGVQSATSFAHGSIKDCHSDRLSDFSLSEPQEEMTDLTIPELGKQ